MDDAFSPDEAGIDPPVNFPVPAREAFVGGVEVYMHSSGSTGLPKPIPYTHDFIEKMQFMGTATSPVILSPSEACQTCITTWLIIQRSWVFITFSVYNAKISHIYPFSTEQYHSPMFAYHGFPFPADVCPFDRTCDIHLPTATPKSSPTTDSVQPTGNCEAHQGQRSHGCSLNPRGQLIYIVVPVSMK
jgi:hypothetical protein